MGEAFNLINRQFKMTVLLEYNYMHFIVNSKGIYIIYTYEVLISNWCSPYYCVYCS